MSIIHVTDCFLPRLGGIEVQVAGLAREQAARGEDVHVVTATRLASPGDGYAVHRIAVRLPWDVPVHPRAGSHLDRVIASLSPSVVHVHVGAIAPFAWSGVRSAARLGVPAVVVVHSMWDPAVRWCYRVLDRVASWSSAGVALAAVS
ncbi:MAG: glycosyltransferase, partial [Saccharothrix sp.]|nr:glycosyltransferase [Saccharothrix sp.]